eukprot:scaffold7549_cov699-Prasinococcus_capsulatus_cf.AAC.3
MVTQPRGRKGHRRKCQARCRASPIVVHGGAVRRGGRHDHRATRTACDLVAVCVTRLYHGFHGPALRVRLWARLWHLVSVYYIMIHMLLGRKITRDIGCLPLLHLFGMWLAESKIRLEHGVVEGSSTVGDQNDHSGSSEIGTSWTGYS